MPRRYKQASLPGMEPDPGIERVAATAKTPPPAPMEPGPPMAADAATTADEQAADEHLSAELVGDGEMPDLKGKTVWAIDANSLIFQVFHAIPEMTSPTGEPVNAVFGFTRDLLFVLEQKKPDYLFCAFDLPGPTFRHELYADYKVHRAEMPEELRPQFPHIRRMVEALGVPVLELEGYEADDLLATVAYQTELAGGQCFVITADKDCRQLISDRVRLYNVRKHQVYDAQALADDWNIRPDQVVDFQSLVGDPVDHVPGVPLIGPKIAAELLTRFDNLENLFAHLDEIKQTKRRQNLEAHQQQALLSRQLVRLESEVPVEVPWNFARVEVFRTAPLIALCQEFGFHRFVDQIRQMGRNEPAAEWQAHYRTVATADELAQVIDTIRRAGVCSVDTETTSLRPAEADIVGFALAWAPGEACYVPVRAPEGQPSLDPQQANALLRPLLADPAVPKVGQNLKYDMVVLRSAGLELCGLKFDTMVASYLLDAGERNHGLDELARRYLNHDTIKISELIGTGKKQRRMDEIDVEQVTRYAAEDADVPLRLIPLLEPGLKSAGLDKLFNEVELPLVEVLAELEFNGIRVDVGRLAELSVEYGQRLAGLEREIYALAGHEFNIASPKQLAQVLFVELGLPVVSKTKTGPSTDVDVLEELARHHELPARVIEYRQYAKLKGTYIDALPTMVNPATGRVHASFHQAVAATGRLSSSDPNLQNIPIRTAAGREIRSAFLPGEEGWQLLAADYSQIELRVLAHFSGDETLCAAFERDEDIHALVASQVYGVALTEVTAEMRRNAKAVNFGVIYGQSPFGLAKALGIEQAEAAEFIDAYFARYPGVDRLMAKILEDCRRQGYVTTILGRRRAIRGIRPAEVLAERGRQRTLPERTAINTVIQGSAADLIKLAMIAVHRRLRQDKRQTRLLLQIHDELVLESPNDELAWVAEMVREAMSHVLQLKVPLKVDVKSGHNWAETEPWTSAVASETPR